MVSVFAGQRGHRLQRPRLQAKALVQPASPSHLDELPALPLHRPGENGAKRRDSVVGRHLDRAQGRTTVSHPHAGTRLQSQGLVMRGALVAG